MLGMLIAFFGIFFIFWGGLAFLIIRMATRRGRARRAMWGAGSAGSAGTWFDTSGGSHHGGGHPGGCGGGHHSGCGGGGGGGCGGGGCGGGGSS